MSSYTCSYCKTGVMSTSEQYLKHISGTKHKKKAFQLQAPFQGIEYEEFRIQQAPKPAETYQAEESDFPSLSTGIQNNEVPQTIQYSNLRNTFKNTNSRNETVGTNYESIAVTHEGSEDEERYNPTSIDELFNKDNCKPSSALHSIDEFYKNKKTAAQSINEVAQFMDWELDFEQGAGEKERYSMQVYIDGAWIGKGEGENKKIAKQEASRNAIGGIRPRIKQSMNGDKNVEKNDVPTIPNNVEYPADAYRDLTFSKLKEIEDTNLNRFAVPRRYAAFIITEQPDQIAKDGTVVAFGAGDGALSDSALNDICLEYGFTKLPGYFLRNFDCLVLARRSLQCFFYNQLLMFFDTKNRKRDKVFVEINKNGFIRLKQGCRLHLFMSHAPHGDCTESIPNNWEELAHLTRTEMNRDKMGKTEPIMFMSYNNNQYMKQPGHIRVLVDSDSMKWLSIVDYRSRRINMTHTTMSPTDKLMSWIHLGVQGALLSHLMEPTYLYSIQFGKNYMHQHISRALLCRVPIDSLKQEHGRYYKSTPFKDPFLARVSEISTDKPPSRYLKKDGVCFNWYLNPISDFAEIIDTKTGCLHGDSPFKLPHGEQGLQCSRLSKVCMLVRLKNVFNAAVDYYALKPEFRRNRDIQGINQAAQYNYCRLKNSARDYRQLKQTLFYLLESKRYGDWQPNEEANKFDLLDYYELNQDHKQNGVSYSGPGACSNQFDDYDDL